MVPEDVGKRLAEYPQIKRREDRKKEEESARQIEEKPQSRHRGGASYLDRSESDQLSIFFAPYLLRFLLKQLFDQQS